MIDFFLAVCLAVPGQIRGPISPPTPTTRTAAQNPSELPPPSLAAGANNGADRIVLQESKGSDDQLRECNRKLPKATRMLIGWPGLTDSALAVVAEARDLAELEISAVIAYSQDNGPVGAVISADGWKALGKLPNLRRLSVRGVWVNEETCRAIANLPALRELELNCLVDDRAVVPIAGMTALTRLDICQRGLSAAAVMKVVAVLRDLEHLNVSRTPVGDGDMKVIAGLPRLKTLTVYETNISDDGVLALTTSPTLTRVTLDRWKSRDFKAVYGAVEKARSSTFLYFVGESIIGPDHPFILKPDPGR